MNWSIMFAEQTADFLDTTSFDSNNSFNVAFSNESNYDCRNSYDFKLTIFICNGPNGPSSLIKAARRIDKIEFWKIESDDFVIQSNWWKNLKDFLLLIVKLTLKSSVLWLYEPPIHLTIPTNSSEIDCAFVIEIVSCLNECKYHKRKARFPLGKM